MNLWKHVHTCFLLIGLLIFAGVGFSLHLLVGWALVGIECLVIGILLDQNMS